MLNFSVKKKKGAHNVHIRGSMYLQHLPALLKRLRKLCDGINNIVFNISDVTEVDLSGLQLLSSAQRTLREQGKTMIIEGKCPEALINVMESTGYINSPIYNIQSKGDNEHAKKNNDS